MVENIFKVYIKNNMENGEKIKVHERLSTLEAQMDTVLDNHLPHIQKSIDKVTGKIGWFTSLLIANLVAVIMTMIKLFFPNSE